MEEILDDISQRRDGLARFHPRVLSRRRQASRARDLVEDSSRRSTIRSSMSATIPRRACRFASASGATVRSCSSARAARARARRCPTTCRRPISRSSKAVELLKAKAEGPRSLGDDPEDGSAGLRACTAASVRTCSWAKRRTDRKAASRAARRSVGMSEDTITLDDALKLLSLPRELGATDDGEVDRRQRRRFGPYVKHGDEFRSLEPEDDVYTVTLDAREGAARAGEEVEPAASARPRSCCAMRRASGVGAPVNAPRRPLRSVRHRRHDQRVAAEGHGARGADDGARRWRCSRRATGAAEGRVAERRRRQARRARSRHGKAQPAVSKPVRMRPAGTGSLT